MTGILNEIVEGKQFELTIDMQVFPKDIALKSAYNFLDRGYFFFQFNAEWNLILQFTAKADVDEDPKMIIGEFSDEMLAVYLRDKLEKDNKKIRETIVEKAINGPIDMENFVSLDTDRIQENQIDFDQDIDEILKEIEADTDISIDENEIENILKEIEQDSAEIEKPQIFADKTALKDAQKMFKK